jgi:hypothetical protein
MPKIEKLCDIDFYELIWLLHPTILSTLPITCVNCEMYNLFSWFAVLQCEHPFLRFPVWIREKAESLVYIAKITAHKIKFRGYASFKFVYMFCFEIKSALCSCLCGWLCISKVQPLIHCAVIGMELMLCIFFFLNRGLVESDIF